MLAEAILHTAEASRKVPRKGIKNVNAILQGITTTTLRIGKVCPPKPSSAGRRCTCFSSRAPEFQRRRGRWIRAKCTRNPALSVSFKWVMFWCTSRHESPRALTMPELPTTTHSHTLQAAGNGRPMGDQWASRAEDVRMACRPRRGESCQPSERLWRKFLGDPFSKGDKAR